MNCSYVLPYMSEKEIREKMDQDREMSMMGGGGRGMMM